MHKKLEIRRGDKEQWKPTSTAWIYFFSSTRIFVHTFRKIPYNFFLCCVRISRIMNAKKLEIRRGDKEQWNPTCTAWNFFFSFTRIFLHTFRKIPYNFFLCCVRISRKMNAKKSRNSKGRQGAMESHFYSMEFFFFFHENFSTYILKYSLQFFFYAVFAFPE